MKDLFKYRDLLMRLAWKEIRVRYKEPILGFLWALLVPLFMTLVFMFVFTKIVKIPFGGYPFFLFLATGLFPWNFFGVCVSTCTMSILEGGELIKKVYFPRAIIPLSVVVANAINFILTLVVLIFFIIFLKIKLSLWILLLPFAILLQIILLSGLVLLISGLQVIFRDIKFMVEVGLLLLFYLTPVFYPLTLVFGISDKVFNIYNLNPMVGIMTLYRIALLGDVYLANIPAAIHLVNIIMYSFLLSLCIFFIGYLTFKRNEPVFADLIR